tara:strand:- start:837 stop:1667 length:831 start_codon:yes stop_codon:yes gene_type:complete
MENIQNFGAPEVPIQSVQQTEQTKQTQFPSEEVTLPSKGLLYPEGSPLRSGVIEMKYMTAKEEDILTNSNYINNGTVIDKLLKSLIISPINFDELLIGDKNAVLVASRILGYGQEYSFNYKNPDTGEEEQVTVDLTEAIDKTLDESLIINNRNEFQFELPISKIQVTFKLLTHGDEIKITNELKGLKKISKTNTSDVTTRMKHLITSVGSDRDIKTIREFVDGNFLARDSRALRSYVAEMMPDIDLTFDLTFDDGASAEGVTIPIGPSFFWPESGV